MFTCLIARDKLIAGCLSKLAASLRQGSKPRLAKFARMVIPVAAEKRGRLFVNEGLASRKGLHSELEHLLSLQCLVKTAFCSFLFNEAHVWKT